MKRLWKRLGLRLFGFDLDTEFLRGVAFGREWYEQELRGQGNASTGPSYNLTLSFDSATRSEHAEVDDDV